MPYKSKSINARLAPEDMVEKMSGMNQEPNGRPLPTHEELQALFAATLPDDDPKTISYNRENFAEIGTDHFKDAAEISSRYLSVKEAIEATLEDHQIERNLPLSDLLRRADYYHDRLPSNLSQEDMSHCQPLRYY